MTLDTANEIVNGKIPVRLSRGDYMDLWTFAGETAARDSRQFAEKMATGLGTSIKRLSEGGLVDLIESQYRSGEKFWHEWVVEVKR